MKKFKSILVFIVLASASCYSQTTFSHLDSLLNKNFHTVNNRDSVSYLKLINQSAIFNGKKLKSKVDSLKLLNPFLVSFAELIDNLQDMTAGTDFIVKYADYELINKDEKIPESGVIRIHANMIVNNTFRLTMPMWIVVKNSQYSIESPMMIMFLEGK